MRIDPKYFPHFLAVIAALGVIAIAFFTISNRQGEKADFRERMFAQDSLQTEYFTQVQSNDSLQVADYRGRFVVLDFWATWSDLSLESHKKLSEVKQEYPRRLQVMAAAVGLPKEEAISYIEEHEFPFEFVAGSRQFSAYGVPGLPAQLVYDPQGKLQSVFMGYRSEAQYDSLRSMLTNGSE